MTPAPQFLPSSARRGMSVPEGTRQGRTIQTLSHGPLDSTLRENLQVFARKDAIILCYSVSKRPEVWVYGHPRPAHKCSRSKAWRKIALAGTNLPRARNSHRKTLKNGHNPLAAGTECAESSVFRVFPLVHPKQPLPESVRLPKRARPPSAATIRQRAHRRNRTGIRLTRIFPFPPHPILLRSIPLSPRGRGGRGQRPSWVRGG
jgi:hypothetical protein